MVGVPHRPLLPSLPTLEGFGVRVHDLGFGAQG